MRQVCQGTVVRHAREIAGYIALHYATRRDLLWSNNYQHQLIREDIRDLTQIKKFDSLEILYSLLPLKVGNPLSLSSLNTDVQVSVDSVKTWFEVFKIHYLIFRISPWTHKIPRAIKKEKKVYLFCHNIICIKGQVSCSYLLPLKFFTYKAFPSMVVGSCK